MADKFVEPDGNGGFRRVALPMRTFEESVSAALEPGGLVDCAVHRHEDLVEEVKRLNSMLAAERGQVKAVEARLEELTARIVNPPSDQSPEWSIAHRAFDWLQARNAACTEATPTTFSALGKAEEALAKAVRARFFAAYEADE